MGKGPKSLVVSRGNVSVLFRISFSSSSSYANTIKKDKIVNVLGHLQSHNFGLMCVTMCYLTILPGGWETTVSNPEWDYIPKLNFKSHGFLHILFITFSNIICLRPAPSSTSPLSVYFELNFIEFATHHTISNREFCTLAALPHEIHSFFHFSISGYVKSWQLDYRHRI